MSTLKERLVAERKRKGWSQTDLANEIGIAQSFISALESRNQLTSGWLPEIAHALGVDAYWLKTGKGERTVAPSLSQQEQVLLNDFRALTDEKRIEYSSAIALEAELIKARAKIHFPSATDLRPTGT